MKDESLAIRNLSFIVYKLGGGKSDINSIWPLDSAGKTTVAQPTKEWWEKIKKRHSVIDKNISELRKNKK